MQIGIFAKTFETIGAQAAFEAVRSAGFSCTQFNMACLGIPALPDHIDRDASDSVALASQRADVAIVAVSGTYNMIHPNPMARQDGLRRLGVVIGSARSMGTGLVTLCTGTRDPDDQWRHHPDNGSESAWRDLLQEMEKAIGLAEQYGVDLGVEPEPGNVVATPDVARRLIDSLGSERIRIVLDSANISNTASPDRRRAVIERAVDLLSDRIAIGHAKDLDQEGRVVAAGKGSVDFPHFISTLRSRGFDGPLVTHGLTAHEAPGAAAFLKSAVAMAEVGT